MKTKILSSLVFLLLASLNHTACAASFDCQKASSQVENMICSDNLLSELDDSLTQTYKKALASSTDKNALKAEQRSWLINVRNKCATAPCLTKAYSERQNGLLALTNTPAVAKLGKEAIIEEGNANKAMGTSQPTAATAQSTKNDADLEKAWACWPHLLEWGDYYVMNFHNRNCSSEVGQYLPHSKSEGLPPETVRLAELLIKTYHINLNNKNSFQEFNAAEKIWIERQQAQDKMAKQAEAERARKLRAGQLKIANMADALSAYPDNDSLRQTAYSPMLTPNGAVMTGDVKIEAQEKPGFLRVLVSDRENVYAYLDISKKTTDFSSEGLRLGAVATVIGTYIRNVEYKTVLGQTKTAPVFEVIYLRQR